jgi:GNAT superfamily N-acetyltransferase
MLDEESRAADWRNWLGEGKTQAQIARDENGAPAGFVSYGPLRTPPPGMSQIRPLYSSEIYALYILPAYWRQKLGTQLMGAAALHLRTLRHRSLCLWVLERNKRAVTFYKARGGQRCGKKEVEIGGAALTDIAMGWRDTVPLLPPA